MSNFRLRPSEISMPAPLFGRREPISADRAREHRTAAVARHPHAIIFDASVQLTASPMLLEESVEIADQRPHGAAY